MTGVTVTLGNRPDLDPDERRQRALRARDVLAGAGWVFDELITDLTRDLLSTLPDETDKRESLYHQIDGAAQAKGHLKRIIDMQTGEEKARERKTRNDPPAHHE